MNYYEVLPADSRYFGQDALTYSSKTQVRIGQIVSVSVNKRTVFGVVVKKVQKPSFTVKELVVLDEDLVLAKVQLELLEWLRDYYPGGTGIITSHFLPKSLLLKKKPSQNSDAKKTTLLKLPRLTDDQMLVMEALQKGTGSFLLHGETGSGKTRVYQELAKETLKEGRSVLILSPEIALTAQLIESFQNIFPSEVVVLHSALTPAKRREAWLKILGTKPVIVVGPRSALFSPIQDLGLIVVDEAHEAAYKQEQTPYYYGLRVASKLAALHEAKLIFGTATPSVTEYYHAQTKNLPILRLEKLAVDSPFEKRIKIVNARDKSNFTRDINLSDTLLESVESALKNHEQSLVFLNRRGTARIILCQNCGWQALCPNCDLPLTYHGDEHSLRCHTCGHRDSVPGSCPECHSSDILFRNIGTKSIAASLERLFPSAKIARFDADNTVDERFEKQYKAISRGEVDILVGTQILAKGLDLPKLSVVGVVAAESSLYFPDYTASERTYQLLTQVIGRIGRGHRNSEAIIQTYEPDSPLLKAAIDRDWQSFYAQQLEERRLFGFPPYYHLLKLTARRKTKAGAQKTAEDCLAKLKALNLPVIIMGPAPAFHEKIGGQYQWQLIIKAKQRAALLKVIANLPAGWTPNIDPLNLL